MFSCVEPIVGSITVKSEDLIVYRPALTNTNTSDIVKKTNNNQDGLSLLESALQKILSPDVCRLSDSISRGCILRGISVKGNHLYRLSLDIDIRWSSYDRLAPTVQVIVRGIPGSFVHKISSIITRVKPVLNATIAIPQDVDFVQIEVLVEHNNTNTYELEIHTNRCMFEACQFQELQSSSSSLRPLGRSFHAKDNSNVQTNCSLLSIVDHVCLVHSQEVSLSRTKQLQDTLKKYGLSSQLFVPEENQQAHVRHEQPHTITQCSGCCFRHMESITTNSNTQINVPSNRLLEQQRCWALTLANSLDHCANHGRESVLCLSDQMILHKNWSQSIEQHIARLPYQWSVLMLSSNQIENKDETVKFIPSHDQLEMFYSLSAQSVFCGSAMIVKGTELMRSISKFLRLTITQSTESDPLALLSLFLLQTNKDKCFVWFPNLVTPNLEYHQSQQQFKKTHGNELLNYRPDSILYWDIVNNYDDFTTIVHDQRLVHVLLILPVIQNSYSRLRTIWQAMNKQTYKNWVLHVLCEQETHCLALSESLKNDYTQTTILTNYPLSRVSFHSDFIIGNNIVQQKFIDRLNELLAECSSPNDWVAWQSHETEPCPWRLEQQISAWQWDDRINMSSYPIGTAGDFFVSGSTTYSSSCRVNAVTDLRTLFGTSFGWQHELALFQTRNLQALQGAVNTNSLMIGLSSSSQTLAIQLGTGLPRSRHYETCQLIQKQIL